MSEPSSGQSYWVTPQDISYHWSLLAGEFQSSAVNHANEEMTISLIVGNGVVADVLEARYCRYEPRSGNGKHQPDPQPWWSLIRRLMAATAQLNGRRAMLTTRVMLNTVGQPVRWTQPEVLPLEPSRV